MNDETSPNDLVDRSERLVALAQLESWIERPMQLLGFVWLGLLILELTRGLSPILATLSTVIWVLFILEFLLRVSLAPEKRAYLRRNWLIGISLAVPALRIFRFARAARVVGAARAARGIRLVRVVSSVNRGIRTLGESMGRRGLGYAVALTVLVTTAGAAGIQAFERDIAGSPLADYPSAIWWTAMVMTTLGSEYWPKTAEGRVLCTLLALYGFAVFGYLTASVATYFIEQGEHAGDAQKMAGPASIESLRLEIEGLRTEIRALGPGKGGLIEQ